MFLGMTYQVLLNTDKYQWDNVILWYQPGSPPSFQCTRSSNIGIVELYTVKSYTYIKGVKQNILLSKWLIDIFNWLWLLDLTRGFVFYIPDEWYMFDDDNVTCVTAEDVLKLSGGGNSINHTLLLSFLIRHIPFTFQNIWDALN